MKLITLATAITLLTTAAAHSWLHCTNHNNTGVKAEMAAAALETPPRTIDPLYVPSNPPHKRDEKALCLILL